MRLSAARLSMFGLALALGLPSAWSSADQSLAAAAVARDRSASSAAALSIGGTPVGNVRSALGGTLVAMLAEDGGGRGASPKKRVAAVAYEDLVLELDLSLEPPIYDWIGAAWKGATSAKSGSLLGFDANREARAVREFENAVITETIFPACDIASKEVGIITLALAPARVASSAAGAGKSALVAGKQKGWVSSNFRLELDGLDATRVSRIEPIVVKQTLTGAPGASREPSAQPGKLEFRNLRVTLSEASGESWQRWHADFSINGNATDKHEKSGRLVLLSANLKDELAQVRFFNVGMIALRPRLTDAGSAALEAELYVERMELSVGGGK